MSNAEGGEGRACLKHLEQRVSFGPIHHLPIWSAFLPERVEPGVRQLIEGTAAGFSDLERTLTPTWSGLMEPLEQLEVRLGQVLGPVSHLTSVKYTDELQAAFDAVRPAYVELANRMSQSRPVYTGLVSLRDGPEWSRLDAAQQRIVSESIQGMERSGVHLEGEAKVRYQEIQERLSKLSTDFGTHLVKEEQQSRIRVSEAERVRGIPPALLDLAASTAREDGEETATAESGPWHFVVNGVNYMAVIELCEHRSLREDFYRAFRGRGTSAEFDNTAVLEEILRLRQEEAKLVGFDSYAALSLDAKMAPSLKAVWDLMDELDIAARPVAEREFEELVGFMRERGADEVEDPRPWDIAFWSEKLREARYGYDAEALRDYFQMPRVLDGLFTLIQKLYGVEIREADVSRVPTWDDSVSFFEVTRGGEIIAGFYVDPYARPGEKRGGAWMNTVVSRSRVLAGDGQSSSVPVALFVMNGRPPTDDNPALMSLDEVRTLFHEFGHATQHMFTTVEEGGASGMSLVEWDAVELASQFNEYWMEHKPFLRDMTAQIKTGEPLDDETLDRVLASKNFMIGNATLRQVFFGKADFALHERYGLAGANQDATPFDIERDIAEQTLVTPRLDGETSLPAFGHLFAGGYAAGYYSYKWAEVLAADAFAAFKEVGLEDDAAVAEVAARFRDTVLSLGGSLPAAEVYRLFRGRDATPAALLKEQGLS